MSNLENIRVFYDTRRLSRDCYPSDEVDVTFYYGNLDREMVTSQVTKVTSQVTTIEMVCGGTAETGYKHADKEHTAVLNFADAMKYGGWVENGAQTQEENLCRCTNLHRVLGRDTCADAYYIPNTEDVRERHREVYIDNIIYAKGITMFKDDTNYNDIEPRKFDVITCPCPAERLEEAEAMEIYTRRIEQIILSAIDNGVECIVLGAWGCGAFAQNPIVVARAFAKVLNEYGNYFKRIIFAIKYTPNWGSDHNYSVFKTVLSEEYKGGITE